MDLISVLDRSVKSQRREYHVYELRDKMDCLLTEWGFAKQVEQSNGLSYWSIYHGIKGTIKVISPVENNSFISRVEGKEKLESRMFLEIEGLDDDFLDRLLEDIKIIY